MASSNLAELASANFELNRSLLQLQSAQTACNLSALQAQIAVQTNDLALIRYQQAENSLAFENVRSQSSQVQTMITTEVKLSEALFRRLQALLDANPTQSIDTLFAQALEVYFSHLPQL
jgi:hypothetical protein